MRIAPFLEHVNNEARYRVHRYYLSSIGRLSPFTGRPEYEDHVTDTISPAIITTHYRCYSDFTKLLNCYNKRES